MTFAPFRILAIVLLIAVNGYFAGAEVALLSVRHSRLRQMAEEGQAEPGGTEPAFQSGPPSFGDAGGGDAGQPGIGLGGRRHALPDSLGHDPRLADPRFTAFVHGACFVLSFLIISYFHVVLGEVVPKNLAIAKADRLAALVAPALLVF